MKAYQKTVDKTNNNYIDSETGEILERVVHTNKIVIDKTKFFLAFYTLLPKLRDKNVGKTAISLYCSLLEKYDPGVTFRLSSNTKLELLELMESTSTNYRSVDNAMKSLINADLVLKKLDKEGNVVKGDYVINPSYAFKGSNSDRLKSISLIMDMQNRTYSTETIYSKNDN